MSTGAVKTVALAGVGIVGVTLLVSALFGAFSPAPHDSSSVRLATSEPVVPDADGNVECLLAATEGTLASHPISGLGLASAQGDVFPIVWPHGWSGRDAGDWLELLAPDGRVLARTGDHITGAGGQASIQGQDYFALCPVGVRIVPAGR